MSAVYRFDLDRARGAIFGCALGDALGLPAEGRDKEILAERYPGGLALPHAQPCRDFPLNDWTDDTDLTVLVMRAMARGGDAAPTHSPARIFARDLVSWRAGGFPELGDTMGNGCGNTIWRAQRMPGFTEDPFAAAAKVEGPRAGNGALMRTAPCAFVPSPAAAARYFALTTHCDPLAVASCVAQTHLIRKLALTPTDAPIDVGWIDKATAACLVPYQGSRTATEFVRWCGPRSLAEIDANSRDGRGYTMRSFACSLWAFRRLAAAPRRDEALFRETLTELVMEGGDADTNGAIAGALVGAALGYEALPGDWLAALPHHDWLLSEVDTWFAAASERCA